MGEAKRRRDRERAAKAAQPQLTAAEVEERTRKCSRKAVAWFCCVPDAWEHVADIGTIGFYVYGEPLPPAVIDVAVTYGIDPHDLDYHVEGVHGWEPHDVGYDEQVPVAADCMIDGGYLIDRNYERCRSE